MKFWDTSAIITLCIDERATGKVKDIAENDGAIVIWWGSIVECYSAFGRLRREGTLNPREETEVLAILSQLERVWTEIEPSDDLREITRRLIQNYPLRAGDSLRLAAAIVWADKAPRGHEFVCLDSRLRSAAHTEGFTILPPNV